MSFNNAIFGPVTSAPAMIYTSSNMSSDNISCTNLSGSIATFDQLEVVTFNPISFSADYADITNLSCDNLSCQFKSTFGSISTGNISADQITLTGNLNASEVYAANISATTIIGVANISTPKIYVNDTFFYSSSTGAIVSSLVTTTNYVNYQLGNLDYKIRSVTDGIQYMTCDSTLGNTNISNLSVDNLSTDLLNNLSAGENITLTTEAGTNKLVITAISSSNLSLDNLSVTNQLTCGNNISTPKIYVNDTFFYGSTGAIVSSLVTMSSQVLYQLGDLDYKIRSVTDGIQYMTCDSTLGNTNISNLSVDNLSVTDITTTNLSAVNVSSTELSLTTMRLKDNTQTTRGSWFVYPTAMEIYTQNDFRIRNNGLAGSPNFMVFDTSSNNVNISNLSVSNLDVEFVDLTNNLTAGSNITITSVGGKAEIAWSGGGGVPANLSIDNLSVNFDASIGGALGVGTGVAVAVGNITTLLGNITANNGSINGNNLSVFNDATITRDLKVQRYLDAGKPTFIMLLRTGNLALTTAGQIAVFNANTSAQINGEFATSGGSDVIVTSGGWYRVSWALGFLRTANTGGDRAMIRSYTQKRNATGSFTFDYTKNTISSSVYIRRNNQCREGQISGYNFLYIPAGGAVQLKMDCMVETSTTWTSSFSGISLKTSSNFMVEFVSSAPET
jgi:lactam utilization protein B